MLSQTETRRAVRERYARLAKERKSGSACCSSDAAQREKPAGENGCGPAMSLRVGYDREELATLPGEADLGLGCGNPVALASLRPGETVLDLGSGAGIDCFLASRRVGDQGRVIGVDMTPEMIERARALARKNGYENTEFRLGEIEALPVADDVVDIVISNCVLNLSSDRRRALAEARRVLKPGGRILISDLVSESAPPDFVLRSPGAFVGCLPVQRSQYEREARDAGLVNVKVEMGARYPADAILGDPQVAAAIREAPARAAQAKRFAAGIRKGTIRAQKAEAA